MLVTALLIISGVVTVTIAIFQYYQEKADALMANKNFRDAGLYLEETIRLVEELVFEEGREEQGRFLAKLYLDKAVILNELGNRSIAFKFFEKSIRLYRWLIEENGQVGLRRELVQAQIAQAEFFRQRLDYHSVLQIYHHVVKTLHIFVYQKNQKELMGDLAKAKCFLAEALLMTGQRQLAQKNAEECFKLFDTVLPRTGSIELQKLYFWAKRRFKSMIQ
jgi:tetratricopeptide (TPR) repeat protein